MGQLSFRLRKNYIQKHRLLWYTRDSIQIRIWCYHTNESRCDIKHLKEHNPMMFNVLILTGQLWTYLADLGEQAESRLQFIIRQMQEAENVTDELKEHDRAVGVQAMNSIYNRAKELVIHELVLQ